ncbi:lipid IV(A) 3-deoxy-D-manno-octulosonic acid transferase [Vibrio agarivorans]|uniref:lipid IV(A) 3-deoxy-D-manno-octulosonic acid transferase n=1 Tax=Vibrio agarivorans TaxID=153622 RepID=UPI0025B29794|nr:lipid IV(A) 3-deoxy-D-manno-octulosonic acid transferase [Vibrio agarivorans]MDN3662172.1 lipid IV(A) 3-deoxy-D-manno-octulosonic acid transferase [Vibrio agarivorans]
MKARLARLIYTAVLALVSPILLWGLYRKRPNKPEFGIRWKEHFGFTPVLRGVSAKVIWIHAVSVGEVLASKRLILDLKARYVDATILVTTTTSTGAEQVAAMEAGIEHRYMPIDFSWCVRRFLHVVKPSLLLVVETEVWPNTLRTVKKSGVPMLLVNARLSEKSQNNYQIIKDLISPSLAHFNQILTVHDDDTDRFIELGVAETRVSTMGSLKYDVSISESIKDQSELLKTSYTGRLVFVAASTHAGEDEMMLEAYKLTKVHVPNLLLVLVPRHPERFDSVFENIVSMGLLGARKTQLKDQTLEDSVDVYLADTMGEMLHILGASDMVFMGGSLLGKKVGGHNFVEPALLSKPCLTGPSYYNFQDIATQLMSVGALNVAEDAQAVSKYIRDFQACPAPYEQGATAGLSIVKANQGALSRALDIIDEYIA